MIQAILMMLIGQILYFMNTPFRMRLLAAPGSSNTTCCAPHSGSTWFHVNLTNATADSSEIRICGDDDTTNEDTPLELIEAYIM